MNAHSQTLRSSLIAALLDRLATFCRLADEAEKPDLRIRILRNARKAYEMALGLCSPRLSQEVNRELSEARVKLRKSAIMATRLPLRLSPGRAQ